MPTTNLPRTLASIVALDAPYGVVSIYAASSLDGRDRALVELDHLDRGMTSGEHDAANALHLAVDHAREQLRELPAARGEAGSVTVGFVPVGGDLDDSLWMQVPRVPVTLALFDDAPYVLPLLEALELYRSCGVVAVTRDRCVVSAWSSDQFVRLAVCEVDVDTGEWRSTHGPFNATAARGADGAGTGGARSTITTHDAFADRLEQHRIEELVDEGAPLIRQLAARHGWDRVVWIGPGQVVEAMRHRVGARVASHVDGGDAILTAASSEQLLDRVRRALDAHWKHAGEVARHGLDERQPALRTNRAPPVPSMRRATRASRTCSYTLSCGARLAVDAYDGLHAGSDRSRHHHEPRPRRARMGRSHHERAAGGG